MISLETVIKLKEAGLKWEPQLHDFIYYQDLEGNWEIDVLEECVFNTEKVKFKIENNLWFFVPRLDQMLVEIEALGYTYSIDKFQEYRVKIINYNLPAADERFIKEIFRDSPEDAVALALIWILKQDRR